MKAPNQSFLNTLENLDPLLSVRWSERLNLWIVQRKAYIPDAEMKFLERRAVRAYANLVKKPSAEKHRLLHEIIEEHESARLGKRITLWAKELDRRVYDQLCLNDMQRYGGYARFCDALDAQEAKEQKQQERAAQSRMDDLNKEVFDVLNWMWRRHDSKIASEGVKGAGKLLREALHIKDGSGTPKGKKIVVAGKYAKVR